jgi:hypothetical protein
VWAWKNSLTLASWRGRLGWHIQFRYTIDRSKLSKGALVKVNHSAVAIAASATTKPTPPKLPETTATSVAARAAMANAAGEGIGVTEYNQFQIFF